MEQTRLKRTDYTKPVRPEHSSARSVNIEGVRPAPRHQPVATHPAAIRAVAPVIIRSSPQTLRTGPITMKTPNAKDGHEGKKTFSFRLSLPTLRRPPGGAGELPKLKAKWLLIATLGAIFFIIGYTV